MYLGLDLASPVRPSTYALLDGHARLLLYGDVAGAEAVLWLVREHRPHVVGIDAPLTLPAAWRCPDIPCSCGRCPEEARRSAELALARCGIPLYWTTKRSLLRGVIPWARELAAGLVALGVCVIEVYPYGSVRRLFGRPPARKGSRRGREWLQERLSGLVRGLPEGRLLGHDELDAVVAAYTALLWANGQADTLGDAAEGRIVLPRAP